METRSRRSRSSTPFAQVEEFSSEFLEKGSLIENDVGVTRSTTIIKVTESKSNSVDEVTSTNTKSLKKSGQSARASKNWYKTSDYSSEDGEYEVSSTRSITQNDKNQIIKDANAAVNGANGVSALDLYKRSGRYWDVYPKTDYTYSPHSRDRVEIAPGVVAMPNMSRKAIHSVPLDDSQTFSHVEHKQTNTESFTSRKLTDLFADYRPRQLFQNNNERTYSKTTRKSTMTWWTTVKTRIVTNMATIITTIMSIVYFGFRAQTAGFTKLHKLAATVMLIDTWLLWKNNTGSKATKITALCVIPLIILGGWWLWCNLGILLHPHKPEVVSEDLIRLPSVQSDSISANLELHNIADSEIFRNQQQLINSLRDEISQIRSEMLKAEKLRQTDFNRMIVNVWNDPEFLRNQKGFNDYLRTIFIARQELEYKIDNITAGLDGKYSKLINENTIKFMNEVTSKIRFEMNKQSRFEECSEVSPCDQRVKKIVRSILNIYDADKTGLVDYAMESMGAEILSTRCTENYHYGKAVVSVLGIPLWYAVNSPRTLINPGISPGQCWAFQNFPGFVILRLSKLIQIEAFSLEHINRLLVPNGEIDSAPKQFEVYGLTEENDKDPVILGEYFYDYDGEPLQFFDVQRDGQVFEIIELRVISNHGNPNYTCLYRFRVHGHSIS